MIGIRRRVDNEGRVVIPIEIRSYYQIGAFDVVEFFCDEEKIIIKPKKKEEV